MCPSSSAIVSKHQSQVVSQLRPLCPFTQQFLAELGRLRQPPHRLCPGALACVSPKLFCFAWPASPAWSFSGQSITLRLEATGMQGSTTRSREHRTRAECLNLELEGRLGRRKDMKLIVKVKGFCKVFCRSHGKVLGSSVSSGMHANSPAYLSLELKLSLPKQ